MTGNDVERAVADMVAAGALDPDARPGDLTDLVVTHARSLDGITGYPALRTLALLGCSVGDYSALGRLPALRVLTIENSDVTGTAWAAGLGLRVAVLRRNRIRHATEAAALPELQVLDLGGNPLDAATRAAAQARAGAVLVTLDDEETSRINVALADAGTGLAAYREGGRLHACATGLDLKARPESGHVPTTSRQLRLVASGGLSPAALLGLPEPGPPDPPP